MSLYTLYAASRKLHNAHIPVLPNLIKTYIRIVHAATIPYTCRIGEGTSFPHGGQGVVIHDDAVIGKRCTILPNAVIGGRSDLPQVPIIGDDVLIGAGAAILGPVTIGSNSSVGANAVVLHDVPPRSLAVGVPAKNIPME